MLESLEGEKVLRGYSKGGVSVRSPQKGVKPSRGMP